MRITQPFAVVFVIRGFCSSCASRIHDSAVETGRCAILLLAASPL